MQSFHLQLLKQELNRAEKGHKVFKEKLETDRSNFRDNVRSELMPSVVGKIRREMRKHSAVVQNRLNGKLVKLSERQDIALRNGSHSNVIMDGRERPKFVRDILSMGANHPVRAKFNEVHFLADVDKLIRELRENNTEGEKLVKFRRPQKGMQKTYAKPQWIDGSKK